MKKPFLRQLISSSAPPDQAEFHEFLSRVMANEASKVEVVAFLAGLSAKPLCVENVTSFLTYYFNLAPAKPLKNLQGLVNIVGTGGGKFSTFNISTAASFIASAAGAKVLKSGSKAYSSQCGSLDVLEALGIPMAAGESQLIDMVERFGLGFVPATHYGLLLKQLFIKVLPLSFRDIAGFINVIGPMLCPYEVSGQLVGVGNSEHMEVFNTIFSLRKPQKTLLVNAECGLDELCSFGNNECRLISEENRTFFLSAQDLGFEKGNVDQLTGGTVPENATLLRDILGGQQMGCARDTVILNSAALLFLAGVTKSIEEGISLARITIDNGEAIAQLNHIVDWSSKLDKTAYFDLA